MKTVNKELFLSYNQLNRETKHLEFDLGHFAEQNGFAGDPAAAVDAMPGQLIQRSASLAIQKRELWERVCAALGRSIGTNYEITEDLYVLEYPGVDLWLEAEKKGVAV